MTYAQQKDSITTSILLDEVSILSNKNQINQTLQPIFNHDDVFSQHQEINLIKRSQYAIDPSFRANQYEQLNVQLDGGIKAMNACPNRMDPITTHLSLNQIQEVELIKGPYSMRFGPTTGGIINLISKQHKKVNGWDGEISTGFHTNGFGNTNHIRIGYTQNKWDAQAGYNYNTFGDYKDGKGTKVPSKYNSQDYLTKLGLKTKNGSRYEIGFQQQFGRDIAHPTLPMDTSFDDTLILHFIGKTLINYSFLKEIQTRTYYSLVEHQMYNLNRPNAKMMHMITDVESKTIGGKIESIWSFKQLNLFTGLDWLYLSRDGEKVSHQIKNHQTSKTDVWQNSLNLNIGIFVQGEYRIDDKNLIEFGGRLDHNKLNIRRPSALFTNLYMDQYHYEHNLSATLSYNYIMNENELFMINLGRGVRSGDMIERTINLHPVGMDGSIYLGNPNIKPEVKYQMDLSYKNQLKLNTNWFRKLSFEATIFQSYLKNYIVAKTSKIESNQEILKVKQFVNIDLAYKVGFELLWNLELINNWSLAGNINYIYTANKDWNEAIVLTPPFENNLRLLFTHNRFNASLEHLFVNHQNKVAQSFNEKPSKSYNVFNFNSSFKISRDIHAVLNVENILNKFYQPHLNFNYKNQTDLPLMERMANPGRNFKVMINYNF